MASASIQFSLRHALGEKKSWQGKDKQSSRNKVMDLEGRKGNIKREEARQEGDRFSRHPSKNKQDKEVDTTEGLRLKKLY